jgi:hypothetical protein
VESKPPDDLPVSKLFRGTGQACLNTTLKDAEEDVQVIFKSSPMGTQSHGSESNNSFVLWAYGKDLLIRTGHYYNYGGPHHRDWMWSTRSVNNITVDGHGQRKRTADARGQIVAFETTPSMDIVIGEAGGAYEPPALDRFTRAIIFVKPELVVVYDRLEAKEPSMFEYWLHAVKKIGVEGQHSIRVRNDDVACDIDFLTPTDLTFTQTDQYDPNPVPRIKLREWHLTATTPEKKKRMEFVTLYRPHRVETQLPKEARLEKIDGGYALEVELSDGKFTALLPTEDQITLKEHGLESKGAIKCRLERPGAQPPQILEVRQSDLD